LVAANGAAHCSAGGAGSSAGASYQCSKKKKKLKGCMHCCQATTEELAHPDT
jgi:hypothetical protein